MRKKLCIDVCETFRREAEEVVATEDFHDLDIAFVPARCRVCANRTSDRVPIAAERGRCDKVELIGGGWTSETSADGTKGVELNQCFYAVADKRFVDRKQAEGAYLVTPGWLDEWRQHIDGWGFDQDTAKQFFHESCKTILLLDTGVLNTAPRTLAEFAEFVDRPFESHYVGTGYLALTISRLVTDWYEERGAPNRQLADYALLLEMIGTLTETQVESEVVTRIIDIFTMLFGPRRVIYLPFRDGTPESPLVVPSNESSESIAPDRYVDLNQDYTWSESGEGFVLRINHDRELVAIVEVDKIAFPEHRDHYLNLALGIVNVCGLAIANARKVGLIRTDLHRKKTLLQEIHHRVKNNMMAVTGLLNLSIMNSDNEAVQIALQESRTRIQTISLIHESLYRTDTLSSIDMREYLSQLAEAVYSGFGSPSNVELTVDVENVFIAVKQGTPIGLVVNELITNCLKYAFPDGIRGKIALSLQAVEDQIRLRIRDTGVGLSPTALQKETKSFGLVLVRGIIEDQLGGTIEIRNGDGTNVDITFTGDIATV